MTVSSLLRCRRRCIKRPGLAQVITVNLPFTHQRHSEFEICTVKLVQILDRKVALILQ